MINFELKIWNNEKYYQSIQSCISILNWNIKRGKMQKSETDTDPPRGDEEWAQKSLLKKRISFNYYWLQYYKTEILENSCSLYGMKPRSYNFPKF